jgi:hypothetical protein
MNWKYYGSHPKIDTWTLAAHEWTSVSCLQLVSFVAQNVIAYFNNRGQKWTKQTSTP